jgi:hypothetical protein
MMVLELAKRHTPQLYQQGAVIGKSCWTDCYILFSVKARPQLSVAVFRLQFHHTHWCCKKVERLEVPLIKQPPVNPLENEMVLELARPQATVVSAGAVIVGKAAGLIVIRNLS